MRKLWAVIIMGAALGLPACASGGGGGGTVSQVQYGIGGGWGSWGGYRVAPLYVPMEAGPVQPSESAFEGTPTPLPEIPDDG